MAPKTKPHAINSMPAGTSNGVMCEMTVITTDGSLTIVGYDLRLIT